MKKDLPGVREAVETPNTLKLLELFLMAPAMATLAHKGVSGLSWPSVNLVSKGQTSCPFYIHNIHHVYHSLLLSLVFVRPHQCGLHVMSSTEHLQRSTKRTASQ